MEDAQAMLESRRSSIDSNSPHEAPEFYGMAPSWSGSSVFAAHAWDSDLIGGSLEVKPSPQEIHSMAQHLRDSISSGSKSDVSSYRQTYTNDPMTPQQVSSIHSPLAFPHNNVSMMNDTRLPSVEDLLGMGPFASAPPTTARTWTNHEIDHILENMAAVTDSPYTEHHDSISSGSKSDVSSYRQTYTNDPMTPQQVSSIHSPLAFPHNNVSMMNGTRLPSVEDLLGMGPFASAPPTTARTWTNHEIDHILENMAAVTDSPYTEHHGARAEMQVCNKSLLESIGFSNKHQNLVSWFH
jgi:hypothetical protein